MEKLPRLLEHLDGLLLTDALELFRYAKADLDAKKWANADVATTCSCFLACLHNA